MHAHYIYIYIYIKREVYVCILVCVLEYCDALNYLFEGFILRENCVGTYFAISCYLRIIRQVHQ